MENDGFLDTSVVISREFGSSKIKELIIDYVKDFNKHATTYVVAEINRSIVKDAIFLYSMLIEEMDLSAVFARLQRYPLTPRRRNRCLALLEKITNRRQLRLLDAISRLENLVTGLHSLLLKDIDLMESPTNCPIAKERIEKVDNVYRINVSCAKQSAKCDIEKTMEENLDNLKKIGTQEEINSELAIFILQLCADKTVAKGKNCQKLGDILICLEAPENYIIFSTNDIDFGPICKALGKKFVAIK